MIEISMNVCAVHKSGKQINCCISATVVHRMIDLEGAGGPWLDRLALAVRGTRCPLLYHFDMVGIYNFCLVSAYDDSCQQIW